MNEERDGIYPNIFFCPIGKDVDKSTIELELAGEKEDFLKRNRESFRSIDSLFKDAEYEYNKLSFWGTSENSKRLWDLMESEDLIFFSRHDGEIIYMAKIWKKVSKKAGQSISEKFWKDDGQKWCLVYFLKDVRRVSISKKKMNRLAGYREGNYFRGLFKMKDELVFDFFEKFSLYYFYHQSEFKRLEEE